ncbi:MAG TPA: FlgO family outer membrane protein [Candidatus Krumholzibacteria bacterium]|nr:FlgO family outer membrane protein [Candidatus Krumholzibacteria bacterium]
MIGQTISHYQIKERLGQGGMGEVFLAEDLRLRRSVALKLLRQRPGCEDEERSRLMREARAASALNHPNIAVIYDVEETDTPDGRVYLLSMEYVRGKTLGDLAASTALSLDDILDIVAQTADALAEAHARGVVHRDVKPSNVMVAQGRVKVLDFGLAQMQPRVDDRTWSRDASRAPEGLFAGTPHYMSPEQALGRSVDSRSDIFSLGVVLYELLAGQRPFEGDTFLQIADSILHRDPPPIAARFSDIHLPEVERLMMRMLAKDPAARPKDLREIVVELQRLRAGASPMVAPGELSVAVAGFASIGEQAEDTWLGTGLSETVTTALQEIEGLAVWGREQLRESLRRLGAEATELAPDDAVQLGRMIGARWVVAGAYQRLGEQVRVTGRVVEVESSRVVRAVKIDGRMDAIFELQDRVVADLATGLRGSVAAAHEGDETKVVAAYEAYSKGLLNIRADTYESLDRAVLLFERALALDPDYIRAQIELGAAYAQKGDYLVAPEIRERGISILRRVLENRPRVARVWRELGLALVSQGSVREGVEALRRAVSLAPDDSRVLAGLGRGLLIGIADFEEAEATFARAVERNPEAGWYWLQLAHCRALLRDFKRGEKAAKRAIELQEAFLSGQQGIHLVGAYMRLGHLFALQKRYQEARDAFLSEINFVERVDHALRLRIRIELHTRLGAAHLGAGDHERAEEAFATGLDAFAQRVALGADDPLTRYYAAAIHALRGENDEALELLERSVASESRAFILARTRIEPEWDGLRGTDRFERLIA